MTDKKDDKQENEVMWPAAAFAKQMEQFQEAGQQAVEQQAEAFQQMMSSTTPGSTGANFANLSQQLNVMSMGMANFKTRVQSGGRISIPDAEREALDIDEGDIVQTIVIPIKKNQSDKNE